MDIESDKREAVVFAASLVDQVNREDVANMVQVQRSMLQRFEKTNEMLINFNQLSFTRYEASVQDFQKHTNLLYDMKKDLDSIFKRIRSLKQRLSKTYPDAFAACSSVITLEDDEEEEEELPSSSASSQPATSSAKQASAHKSSDKVGGSGKTHAPQPQQAQKSRPSSHPSQQSRGGDSRPPARKTNVPKAEHRHIPTASRPPVTRSSSSASSSSSGQSKPGSSSVLPSSPPSRPVSGHAKLTASSSLPSGQARPSAASASIASHSHSHSKPKPKPPKPL